MSSSKPSGSKTKRKIADEHRNFQEKWELEYFCSEVKDKIICLICNNAISVPILYNIKRHYEQHKSKYDTYEGLMRQEKLKEFKLGMKKQQFMFTKVSQESEAAVHTSYVLSEMIAKHSKPFTEGDFIKECLIKAAEIVCPGSVKTFQAISLSRNTVVERVTDMARNLNDQIKEKSSCFEAFSIACDESTDIGGVAQLAVFFRACDTDFNIFEELLELVPMHGTTTEEDIFNCVYVLLQKYNLPQSKLTLVATDGAPSMTGKTNGFVALLRKKLSEISDGSNIHHMHCIIHQEVLLSVYGEECMSIQIVRRWRSWFLEGRQNVHDDERSGSPVTATDNAAVAAVRNVVEADRRVTIDEIMIRLPPGIEIRRSSIGTIMSDVLNFLKVCTDGSRVCSWKITSNNGWRQPELSWKCIKEMEINCFPVLSLEMKAGCIIQPQKQNDKAWCGRSLRKVHQKRRWSQSLQAKLWLWKTSNGKFSHIHLILRNLPQATSIFIQHSSGTLEASTLRMMTKCRRRRTTGYEDRTRLGTTVVSKNCHNGAIDVAKYVHTSSCHVKMLVYVWSARTIFIRYM
ncbi:hypothetical protein LAZ67_X004213 [Cordylochernes scorpioides]|uniref:SPIN-DOC-like zinc-finger domain-containing protein n=1 Tax=Cordylochernes scorpioides TaxID=51811 RepID=A0ABY6LUS0_9ARAC|nr:hypothetical protein LAZ67_X004213 [Cordylochernes scorpioides]